MTVGKYFYLISAPSTPAKVSHRYSEQSLLHFLLVLRLEFHTGHVFLWLGYGCSAQGDRKPVRQRVNKTGTHLLHGSVAVRCDSSIHRVVQRRRHILFREWLRPRCRLDLPLTCKNGRGEGLSFTIAPFPSASNFAHGHNWWKGGPGE